MEFSSSQAALRIRRVQLLCAQSGLDGVLLVAGVDSRFSVCNQAVGYLLSGRSNRDTIDVVKLDDQLDDVVVLVTPTEVRLYARDSDLREQLQGLLVPHVTSLRILGPTIAEAMDPDLLEENKLASFVHMLRGCRCLGIPCSLAPAAPQSTPAGQTQGAKQPTSNDGPHPARIPQLGSEQLMALEKWPLLQAYGLEGVGRNGFFSMNFKVHDVQAYMQHLYGELDGRSLEVLVSEAVPTLRQHWNEMLQALGGKPAGQRSGLTEKQVVEPLAGYFTYGLLRAVSGVEQAVKMPPRVVFGPRSSDDSESSGAIPLSKCGPTCPGGGAGAQQPPLHMVVEAADPRSPLRVARTYFLARGMVARDVFADPDEEVDQGYSFEVATAGWQGPAAEVVLLMRVYAALVDAAWAAMNHFAQVDGATALSAKSEALEVFSRRAEQLGVAGAGGPAALSSRIRFTLIQMDHANRVTAPAVRGSRQLKILRLSIPDITSRSSSGNKVLGGLVYGDTFLELPPSYMPAPSTASAAGPGARDGRRRSSSWGLLVLTEGAPLLVAIPAGGCEEQLAARALRSLLRVVEGGGAGSAAGLRTASLATQRDQERRAAAAAAESQALAARMRARRLGSPVAAEEVEDLEETEEEVRVAEAAETAAAAAAVVATAAAATRPEEALGRLLTLGGGDDAVLLTGAPSCPSLYGTLYCFSAGLVFVEAVSRAVWVLDLRGGAAASLEAVTMQQLPLSQPQQASAAERSQIVEVGGFGAGLSEAVVFRGASPACGLAPACHLTNNTHVALPLAALSPAARRFLIQTVLPAWSQTCREAAAAATELRSETRSPVSYLKDMDAPNPFPPALREAHTYAIQSSSAVKTWRAVPADDETVRSAIEGLDRGELHGPLSGLDPSVEALLLQGAASEVDAACKAVTLVVGLPGADQGTVAAAIATLLDDEEGPRVALLPPDAEPLRAEHFEMALALAAAEVAVPETQRHHRRRHLILTTSSYLGLLEQLRMLAAAAVGGAAGRWRLAAVVVCVNSDAAYEEPGRGAMAGGLLAQLLPGFVDCVVLGGSDSAKVSELAQLVASRLPEVPQVRSSRTQLLRARQELLPTAGERAARLASEQATVDRASWAPLAAARGGGFGTVSAPSCTSGGLLGPLRAARVVFEGSLDVSRLREALSARGIPTGRDQAPQLPLVDTDQAEDRGRSAEAGGLVCVSGCVRPSRGVGPSELLGTRQSAMRMKKWPLDEVPIVMGNPALPADGQSPGGELLFVGSGSAVEPGFLRELVQGCASGGSGGGGGSASSATPPEAAAATVTTAAELTAAQRAAIREAHLWDPLPEGHCFNGTQYFDAFGDASFDHPEMDRFIAEWIAQQAALKAQREGERRADAITVLRVSDPARL